MSKKRDPVVAVLNYFQEAELPLAKQALVLAASIVKNRVAGGITLSPPSPRLRVRPSPTKLAAGSGE